MGKLIGTKSAQKAKSASKQIKKAVKPSSSGKASKKSVSSNSGMVWPKTVSKTIQMYKDQPSYFALNEKYRNHGIGSQLIHAGNEPDPVFGGVVPYIDLSTTFAQPQPGEPVVFDYQRCGCPTRLALERCLASIEHGKYAFASSSGISATVNIFSLLKSGDHVLCVDDVYGGTQRFLRKILTSTNKIDVDFESFQDTKALKKSIRPNTKIVWTETPTNPTLQVIDIKAVANMLKGTGILFVVDNTFATPVNQNPLDLGADVVLHSLTKYVGGHSDVVAGGIILNDRELYDKLSFNMKTMGTGLAPFESWLCLRGAKTLEVRVQRAQSNAMAIAKLLEKSKKVERVVYPGLTSHKQHHIAKKQMRGFGGMLSFYVKGGIEGANAFLTGLKLFTLAESLGGVESLAENPALMTHGSVPAAHRKLLGIEDNFIRLSVGIESESDLLNDVKQALERV